MVKCQECGTEPGPTCKMYLCGKPMDYPFDIHNIYACAENLRQQRDGIQEQLDFMFRRELELLRGAFDMMQEHEQRAIQLGKALGALQAVMDVLEDPLMGIEKLQEVRDKTQELIGEFE